MEKAMEYLADPDFLRYMGTMKVFLVNYYGLGLLLECIPLLPRWLRPAKLQPDRVLTRDEVFKIVKGCLVPHLTIYPACYLLAWPIARRRLVFDDAEVEKTSWGAWVLQLLALVALTEFLFYWGHRHLHSPALYARIHKVHHEWKYPIGLASLYFHPIEHVHSVFDGIAPPLIIGCSIQMFKLWSVISVTAVIMHHAGYEWGPINSVLPGVWDSMVKQHDEHHEHFIGNYGSLGVMDWLCGTQTQTMLKERAAKKNKAKAPAKAPAQAQAQAQTPSKTRVSARLRELARKKQSLA